MKDRTTVFNLLKQSALVLKHAKIMTYELDAKILLSYALNLNNNDELIFQLESDVSQYSCKIVKELINRRLKKEPIPYITASKYFWKHNFFVNNHVLIPRPESEIMIEVILLKFKQYINNKFRILELGTGSGCIILSVLYELINFEGIAIDISQKAISVAKQNASRLKIGDRVKFLTSDWFKEINNEEKFDLIISNPPYISLKDWIKLESNVKDYEPQIALTDYEDGFRNYRLIAKNIGCFLKKGGCIFLELGKGQDFQIRKIFENYGFKIKFYRDMQNIKRIAMIESIV